MSTILQRCKWVDFWIPSKLIGSSKTMGANASVFLAVRYSPPPSPWRFQTWIHHPHYTKPLTGCEMGQMSIVVNEAGEQQKWMKTSLILNALTAEQWEQRVVLAKDLTIPVLSWFESAWIFCISKSENGVEGGPIRNHSDIQTSVMTKLKTIPITDFLWAMHRLEDRANLCIALNGDYFE